jgi:hypothetical protein
MVRRSLLITLKLSSARLPHREKEVHSENSCCSVSGPNPRHMASHHTTTKENCHEPLIVSRLLVAALPSGYPLRRAMHVRLPGIPCARNGRRGARHRYGNRFSRLRYCPDPASQGVEARPLKRPASDSHRRHSDCPRSANSCANYLGGACHSARHDGYAPCAARHEHDFGDWYFWAGCALSRRWNTMPVTICAC